MVFCEPASVGVAGVIADGEVTGAGPAGEGAVGPSTWVGTAVDPEDPELVGEVGG